MFYFLQKSLKIKTVTNVHILTHLTFSFNPSASFGQDTETLITENREKIDLDTAKSTIYRLTRYLLCTVSHLSNFQFQLPLWWTVWVGFPLFCAASASLKLGPRIWLPVSRLLWCGNEWCSGASEALPALQPQGWGHYHQWEQFSTCRRWVQRDQCFSPSTLRRTIPTQNLVRILGRFFTKKPLIEVDTWLHYLILLAFSLPFPPVHFSLSFLLLEIAFPKRICLPLSQSLLSRIM